MHQNINNMKVSGKFLFPLFLLFFVQCATSNQKCEVREWTVMDLYRRNFPLYIDTLCEDKIHLINNTWINHTFFDSVFVHSGNNKCFSLDSMGAYCVDTIHLVRVKGLDYETAKVRYLRHEQNVDQEFLVYVVKGKGIYIQQESLDKKLFLLKSVRKGSGQLEEVEDVTEKMLKDTVLFPLPPSGP